MRAERDTFVFERVEQSRPDAEHRVLALFKKHEFGAKDFGVSENGTWKVSMGVVRHLVGGV